MTANAATIVVVRGGGYVGSSSSLSSSSQSLWSIVRDPEFYDDYGANGNRNGNVIPSSWFSSGWNVTSRRRHSGTGSVGRGGDGDGGGKSATNVRKRPLGIEEKEEEGGDGKVCGRYCRRRCRRYQYRYRRNDDRKRRGFRSSNNYWYDGYDWDGNGILLPLLLIEATGRRGRAGQLFF